MTHIVVGLGEIGSAIREIFNADGIDAKGAIVAQSGEIADSYDVLHICFPNSEKFQSIVKEYQHRFNPKYTVVHSTVPIGTCNKLNVDHSPCRGKHPSLKQSILTFVKYIGGPNAHVLAEEFRKYGINAKPWVSARDTEAGKLIDLMQLGAMVLLEKEIYAFCEANFLDFDTVYRDFNESYNTGYQALGQAQFTRPIYEHMPGKIGGHCVVQNMPSLDMETAEFIIDENSRL